MHAASRLEVSIDDALQNSVGECGRGQLHVLALTSLTSVAAALINFSFVFTGTDAFRTSSAECFPGSTEACDASITARSPSSCAIPRDSWNWKARCRRTAFSALPVLWHERARLYFIQLSATRWDEESAVSAPPSQGSCHCI